MLPRKLLPCSGITGMLKSSVFFHGPLRGYKTDDKTDVCLLPQSPKGHRSSPPYPKWPFCYKSPRSWYHPLYATCCKRKKISKYEMWQIFYFFFSKGAPISYLFSQALIQIMRPWVCMRWSNLRSPVPIFPNKTANTLQVTTATAVLIQLLPSNTFS